MSRYSEWFQSGAGRGKWRAASQHKPSWSRKEDPVLGKLACFHEAMMEMMTSSMGYPACTLNDMLVFMKSQHLSLPKKLVGKLRKLDQMYKMARHITTATLDVVLVELAAEMPVHAMEVPIDHRTETTIIGCPTLEVTDAFVLEDLPFAATDIITVPSCEDKRLAAEYVQSKTHEVANRVTIQQAIKVKKAKAEAEKKAKVEANKKAKREAEAKAKARDEAELAMKAERAVHEDPDEQQAADMLETLQVSMLSPAVIEAMVKSLCGFFKKTTSNAREFEAVRHELWKVRRKALAKHDAMHP